MLLKVQHIDKLNLCLDYLGSHTHVHSWKKQTKMNMTPLLFWLLSPNFWFQMVGARIPLQQHKAPKKQGLCSSNPQGIIRKMSYEPCVVCCDIGSWEEYQMPASKRNAKEYNRGFAFSNRTWFLMCSLMRNDVKV